MKLTNLIFPTIFIGAILLLFLPTLFGGENDQPLVIEEIEEKQIYCFEHYRVEEVWIIKGERYLVKESPRGVPEITGLYSRTHPKK